MEIHIHSKKSVGHIIAAAEWIKNSAPFLPFTTKCSYDIRLGEDIVTVSVDNVSEGKEPEKG